MKKALLLALCGALFVGITADSAMAQKKKKKRKKVDRAAQFEKLNTSKSETVEEDGEKVQVLTEEEFMAQFKNDKRKKRGKRLFTRLDKNKDGKLTKKEFTTRPKRKKKKKKNDA